MFFKIFFFTFFLSLLMKDILSMEAIGAHFKKVLIDSNFFKKDDVTRYIPETICAISCSRLDTCNGYMPYVNSHSGCTFLNVSDSNDATNPSVTVEVMWDRMRIHKRLNGKKFSNGYPWRMGYNRNWRLCNDGCHSSGGRIAPAPQNYNRMRFYHLLPNQQRVWLDGLRQIGGENFYNSEGKLVLNPNTTDLATAVKGDNSILTGLAIYWRVFRFYPSEGDFSFKLRCLCVPPPA